MAYEQQETEFCSLFTPCAIVDRKKLDGNIRRMREKITSLGVDLRPHIKTTKCVPIARLATEGFSGAITVSTLAEAAYLAEAGFRDIMYAVGIIPAKLEHVARLLNRGVDLKVILDSVETATAVAAWGVKNGQCIPTLLEINSDDHRAGLEPTSAEVVASAEVLATSSGANFRGVMTHAGGSYDCASIQQIAVLANLERDSVVTCADAIRAAGLTCDIVSIGSTPTALLATNLVGVTEVRAGVYPFFDLFQAGLGTCQPSDIALSVLTTVIGKKHKLNRLLTDAGGLALSKDRGTAAQTVDRKYGLVCDAATGRIIRNLIVSGVNQEHGLISTIDGAPLPFDQYPVGTQLRILPNHACMTAAAHDKYYVVDGEQSIVQETWPRIGGWDPSRFSESNQ